MEERVPCPRAYFHDYDDDSHYPGKRSTLTKLKEKAKKWRQTLAKIRSRREDNNGAPPRGVSLEEGDDEEEDVGGGDAVRHHARPKYASEKGHRASSKRSSFRKKSTVHHPRSAAEMESEMKLSDDAVKVVPAINEKKLAPTDMSETPAPAYARVSAATQSAAPKIPEPKPGCECTAARHVWDAGLLVKEYLMQKLEPGEADRALCEVITEAVNPKYATRFSSVADHNVEAEANTK